MSMTATTHTTTRMEPEIDRRDTAIRIVLSLLFAIVAGILDSIVGLIVVFALLWSFVTRRPPAEGLRTAANRIISYDYRIARYLTYNEGRTPFPFSDFPDSIEPSTWGPEIRESEELGFELSDEEDDDDEPDEPDPRRSA